MAPRTYAGRQSGFVSSRGLGEVPRTLGSPALPDSPLSPSPSLLPMAELSGRWHEVSHGTGAAHREESACRPLRLRQPGVSGLAQPHRVAKGGPTFLGSCLIVLLKEQVVRALGEEGQAHQLDKGGDHDHPKQVGPGALLRETKTGHTEAGPLGQASVTAAGSLPGMIPRATAERGH